MSAAKQTVGKCIYKEESIGNFGVFQIEIIAGASRLPNLDNPEIQKAAGEAATIVKRAVMAEVVRNSPEALKRAADEKAAILALFPGQPFVEEIPNGYCSDWCCKHLPWFVVTTLVGRIKIGWRKRVIEIDWSETHRTKNSHELFAGEDVTKDERMIHAWSYEDAKRYIDAILQSEVKGS